MDRDDLPHREMDELNHKIWNLLETYTSNKDDLLMSAAVLMKSAVQLYTVVMNDEDIAAILSHEIVESIPTLRAKLEDGLYKRTIH